jgi:glucosamine 6-phosphate synthetase-like amidotransferase/phosphosugar isomerase protein
MCNINYLWKKKGITKKELSILEVISFNSWLDNNDGEGYLTSKGQVNKSLTKIHPIMQKDLLENCWTIWHERYTTHGGNVIENTQPLETEKIVFIHNGVMQIKGDSNKSDSRLVAEKITELMKTKSFVNAFIEVMNNVSGSKSIFVFEKQTKKLYYYKNYSSTFKMIKGETFCFGSTNYQNIEYLQLINKNEKIEEVKIEDGVLYEVRGKSFIPISKSEEKRKEVIKEVINVPQIKIEEYEQICIGETKQDMFGNKFCSDCGKYGRGCIEKENELWRK